METMELLRLLDELEKIRSSLESYRNSALTRPHADRSFETNELMASLAKAQGEMKIAGKDSNNPYFKSRYADLASIVEASRPSLTKHGLSVMQQITISETGQRVLITTLGHSSGQYIQSRVAITPVKDDMQSLGSAITYMRRYAYASLVGVVASDEDDDGEVAMKPLRQQPTSAAAKFGAPAKNYETISKDELEMIQYELAAMPDLAQNLLDRYQYESLADIPKNKFRAIWDRVLEIKREREGIKA